MLLITKVLKYFAIENFTVQLLFHIYTYTRMISAILNNQVKSKIFFLLNPFKLSLIIVYRISMESKAETQLNIIISERDETIH